MQADGIPPWCDWYEGRSRFLIVAPHGGRRRAGLTREHPDESLKVNDLHTADVAALLAEGLDASLLSNPLRDRNELDLNRISQVLEGAPWFLDLIELLLAKILRRHEVAEVLVVHGWNVTQKRCDVGVGAFLQDESQAESVAHRLTVSPDYLVGRLRSFRQNAAAAGIHVTWGERYPARHPNNLLQLFRRSAHQRIASARPRLAAWAAAGRVQAVQLELGAPLRWPGTWRERLLDGTVRVFGAAASAITLQPGDEPPTMSTTRPPVSSPQSLQFYDPRHELGVMGRVDANPAGTYTGSRILLLRGPLTAALFTGEERTTRSSPLGGPCFSAEARGLRLTFDGPLLQLPDARRYVELEQALAASHLVHASVQVSIEDSEISGHGHVRGTVCIDGDPLLIDTFGFTRVSVAEPTARGSASRTTLTASLGDRHMLRVRSDGNGSTRAVHTTPSGDSVLAPSVLTVDFAPDRCTPRGFSLAIAEDRPVVASPVSQMVIRRPNGQGGTSLITFGVASFSWDGYGAGFGFYEHAQPLTPATSETTAP